MFLSKLTLTVLKRSEPTRYMYVLFIDQAKTILDIKSKGASALQATVSPS